MCPTSEATGEVTFLLWRPTTLKAGKISVRLKYDMPYAGNYQAQQTTGYSETHNVPLPNKCQLPFDLSELNSFIFIGDEYVKNRLKSPVLKVLSGIENRWYTPVIPAFGEAAAGGSL